MIDKKENKIIMELINLLGRIDKKDLKRLGDIITSSSHMMEMEYSNFSGKDSRKGYLSLADKNKIEIIGGLPFLLNDVNYFPSSESIKHFSEDILNIKIPKGNKTRPELIGIIIVKIAELPNFETQRINNALNAVMRNVKKGSSKNIFLEWEKAINSI